MKHLKKTELVELKGYQLFHIFENEWIHEVKRKIWLSKIKSKLGLNRVIKEPFLVKNISISESKEFMENNSLDSYVESDINYGLYKDNVLVQVLTVLGDINYLETLIDTKIVDSPLNSYIRGYRILNRRYHSVLDYKNCDIIEIIEPKAFYFSIDSKYKLLKFLKEEKDLKNYRRIFDSGYIKIKGFK